MSRAEHRVPRGTKTPAVVLWILSAVLPPGARAADPEPAEREVRLGGEPAELTLTAVSERTLRIGLAAIAPSGAAAPLPDAPVLVERRWPESAARLRELDRDPAARAVGRFTVEVSGPPLRVRVAHALSGAVQEIAIDDASRRVSFARGDAPIFGLGQGGPQYDRRGHLHAMKNDHGGYRLATHGGRLPIPWLLSTAGWAILFHRPLGDIDLRGEPGLFLPWDGEPAAPLDVFLAAGPPAELLGELARLTGFPSLPPLWALGYQQSHRTIESFGVVQDVARTFRAKRLPCDVLIYLGTGWCPSGWNQGHDSFAFNPRVFSDPASQVAQLKALDFRVVLHSTYPPRRLHGSVLDAESAADESSARRYWSRHSPVHALGVDGWWPDAAENLSVPARLARVRLYWEGPRLDRPNVRPYALHRTGYTGMQRWGGWVWSGDVDSTWETLRLHVALGLNTSLSGVPYWGSDIGGFYPTADYTAEFFVRWFQLMTYCPLFRSHGRTWFTRLPWGWGAGVLGPDEMEHTPEKRTPVRAEMLRDPAVEPILRGCLELRYRLMPYIYSLAREAHESGMPLMRPLWLHHPEDAAAALRDDEFLWGRDLLVAPVLERGVSSRKVYLPAGIWYDFTTGARSDGGREIERAVDLATTPVYARAGAIIAMGPLEQHTGERPNDPLSLDVYEGADGSAVVYEDDGLSFDFERGEWMKLACRWDDRARKLALALVEGSRRLEPWPRRIEVRLLPSGATRSLSFDGSAAAVEF